MKVYLVRHAEPVRPEVDPSRPLTARGMREMGQVADGLKTRYGVSVEKILHSGKVRARQTAEIIESRIAEPGASEEAPGLKPNDDTAPWVGALAGMERDLMLVGHMPFMGILAAGMTKGPMVQFRTSQVICLEKDGGRGWSLAWSISPDDLPL